LRKFFADKQAAWDAMSPAEQREEDEAWERVKATMNEARKGYRLLFVEEP